MNPFAARRRICLQRFSALMQRANIFSTKRRVERLMNYQFDGGAMGKCQVELRTAGKHGFAVPKVFEITCLEKPSAPTHTFRYTNNQVGAVTTEEVNNAALCRIAIAQFLQLGARDHAGTVHTLDPAIPPFEGPVSNDLGVILTVKRLHSPRGKGRGASFNAAAMREDGGRRRNDESSEGS
jgi:hypothetical protein